jgi:hypothetical protein
LTIPYQTIQIVEGGAIGQQYLHRVCNYNATATSTLGVGWVFDIDTELVNNTEHKFIATIDERSHQNTFIRVASGGVEIPVIATFEEGEEQQPYFRSGDHRKFIYAVDNNTSIIMFSAFYTNGQFIIVEPNDIDYAKMDNIDELINGVYPVGKAKADENGNNIANTYATKTELSELQIESENIDEKVSTNTNSYTTDKPYAVLNKLGGMSYKSENLLVLEDKAPTTINGITYSVKDGVVTLNGTSTNSSNFNIYFNSLNNLSAGTYYYTGFTNSMAYNLQITKPDNTYFYPGSNVSFSTDFDSIKVISYIFVKPNDTYNNVKFSPMIVKGSTAPTEYSQGFVGIRDAIITKVNDLNIPSEIQALTGYGWGVNDTCYNYIDFDRKVFVQKVGRVDLGTLDYSIEYNDVSQPYRFLTSFAQGKIPATGRNNNVLSAPYHTAPYGTNEDLIIFIASNGNLYVYNQAYTTTEAFKTAMNGVYLYYELSTPIETDISDYIDGKVVKTNGNIVFDNEYNYPVPSEFILTISNNNVLSQNNIGFIKGEYEKTYNLLNLPDIPSTTENGITYKVKDGVLTLNGTATAKILKTIAKFTLPAGTYYFKSFGEKGDRDTYHTGLYYVTGPLIVSYNNTQFTLTRETEVKYIWYVGKGVSVSNVQFKDMITKGDKPTPIFYPYKGNIVHEKDIQDVVREKDIQDVVRENNIQNFLPKVKHFELAGNNNFAVYFSLQLKYNEEITTVAELFSKLATNKPLIPCSGYYWYDNKVYTLTGLQSVDNTSIELQGFDSNATAQNEIYESWNTTITDIRAIYVYEL